MSTLLQFEKVSIEINLPEKRIIPIQNLSFELQKGTCTALIGESGSGKTLTSLSILNLLPPNSQTQGNIFFWDGAQQISLLKLSSQDINTIRAKKIAMIFFTKNKVANAAHKPRFF